MAMAKRRIGGFNGWHPPRPDRELPNADKRGVPASSWWTVAPRTGFTVTCQQQWLRMQYALEGKRMRDKVSNFED